jgi:hypothetical protein
MHGSGSFLQDRGLFRARVNMIIKLRVNPQAKFRLSFLDYPSEYKVCREDLCSVGLYGLFFG